MLLGGSVSICLSIHIYMNMFKFLQYGNGPCGSGASTKDMRCGTKCCSSKSIAVPDFR